MPTAAQHRSNAAPPRADDRLTPAMRQYREQKAQVGDAILLFRMGDFYELFYEDAELAARVLGITLTSRDNGRTPLAGIPYHALENYLLKLVEAGHKVAISEQVEDPRVAKGIVQRAVVRIVTPGTLTDDALLKRAESNLLAAAWLAGDQAGVAALELASGWFDVQLCPRNRLADELCRLAPAEILLSDDGPGGAALEDELRERCPAAVSYRSNADFAAQRAEQVLRDQFGAASLEGFGFERIDAALQAAGGLLAYVRETQRTSVRHLRPPRRRQLEESVVLDAATLRSLEIERTLRSGAREGSLLAAVDRTCNPMGARLLRQWLCYPLRDLAAVHARQELIARLRENAGVRAELRQALRAGGDVERMTGRLGVQRTTPRDLRALGDALARLPRLRGLLAELPCAIAARVGTALDGLDAVAGRLCDSLAADAPLALKEGGIFAAGVSAELDRLRGLNADGQRWLTEFQQREVQRTGINSLRVAFNKVFGYYIEITHTHRARVPADYVRRQTVKNAERYITDELKRHEDEVLSASARANELEYDLFCDLREALTPHLSALQRVAAALAELDVLAGWAELSLQREYCRPEFVEEPLLEITRGRHPVLEQLLGGEFVPNDTCVHGNAATKRASDEVTRAAADESPHPAVAASLALITGPNMAGKSTYIRQTALLTLLAHCGCYVPAEAMRVGAVDRIFTRVGAADELARGQSTFMVEMIETANILHNATPRSLVILDEVGRGTSTFDGLSLAWAITEHLATQVACRTLFATHYHELTELAELLEGIANLNVAVKEFEDQVVFLHRIVAGAADRSYGLHVARLAGVPAAVLERANAVLNELERTFSRQSQRTVLAAVQRRRQRQLRLFEAPEEQLVRELRTLNPAELSPEKAAEWVADWRKRLG